MKVRNVSLLVGLMVGIAYAMYTEQILISIGVTLLTIILVGVAGMLLKVFLSKPRVIFGKPYVGTGFDSGFCWYVPVMNLRWDSWLRYFCQREDAVDCRVKVRFTKADGELIYNYALWWDDSLIGEILEIGSKPREFPLAFEDNDGEIHLAGTPITTSISALPPYRMQFPTDVIAHVEVISKKKVITKSKWLIEVKPSKWTPVNVRRLEKWTVNSAIPPEL